MDPEKISGPLKKHVFGQDDALNDIAELVAVHKMRKKEKILTVMLLGPTATGKSETAKSLAEIMTGIYGTEYGCIEVAGSEFASSHTVNRFFGAPPGYVGHGQPTVLDPVRQNPTRSSSSTRSRRATPRWWKGSWRLLTPASWAWRTIPRHRPQPLHLDLHLEPSHPHGQVPGSR